MERGSFSLVFFVKTHLQTNAQVEHQHLTYINVLTSEEPTRKPTPAELRMVLGSLVASRAVVLEDGSVVARKPEGERRMLLNIEQGEVERVLSDIGGPRWRNVLSN
jgi:origin recognition complex subunit 1